MADNNVSTPAPVSEEAKSWIQRSKVWLILVIALILSNVGTFLYQNYQQGKLKEALAEDLQNMADKAEALVAYRTATNADDIGLALVHYVQSEMVRNNKGELDLFMNEMVQASEVELVTIVDSVGIVYLSTNKKFENKGVLEVLPGIPPRIDGPVVFDTKTNEALYASPIMALDHRIGTFVMTYSNDKKTAAMLQEIRDFAASKKQ